MWREIIDPVLRPRHYLSTEAILKWSMVSFWRHLEQYARHKGEEDIMATKRTLNILQQVDPLHFILLKGGGLEVFTALLILNIGKIGRLGCRVGW